MIADILQLGTPENCHCNSRFGAYAFYSSRPNRKLQLQTIIVNEASNCNQLCAAFISHQEKARREAVNRRVDKHPVEETERELDEGLLIAGSGCGMKYPESPGSLMYGKGGDSQNQESAILGCAAAAAALY